MKEKLLSHMTCTKYATSGFMKHDRRLNLGFSDRTPVHVQEAEDDLHTELGAKAGGSVLIRYDHMT